MTEHDTIKAILTGSIYESLGQISPMAQQYASTYIDWMIERAFYSLDRNGYAIIKRPTHPAPPQSPAPPEPRVVSAAGSATGQSKL